MIRVVPSLLLVLTLLATAGQAQVPVGRGVLQQRAVQLVLRGASSAASCLGFRAYRPDFPPQVDFIITANHCIQTVDAKTIQVTTMNGIRDFARYWIRYPTCDTAFLVVKPNLGGSCQSMRSGSARHQG